MNIAVSVYLHSTGAMLMSWMALLELQVDLILKQRISTISLTSHILGKLRVPQLQVESKIITTRLITGKNMQINIYHKAMIAQSM